MSNALKIERQDAALIVTFTRPEIRNPLSVDVLEKLIEIVGSMDASALIFTGIGDVFASGADLREIATVDGETAREFAMRGQRLMTAISESPAKTIAAVNGFCYGGALDLALACDIRIASQNAEFCHPGAGLGIMTGWGGTQRLTKLVGEAAALEMFILGRKVDAKNAFAIGLIDAIADKPLSAAMEFYP